LPFEPYLSIIIIIMPGFTRYSGTETHIRIDPDVTLIPECAFENRDFVEVVLPEGLQEIGHCAFDGCTSLKTINLPDGLLSINNGAFRSCNSLLVIDIPSTVTFIGAAAFFECAALKEVSLYEGSLRTIGEQAFYDCPSLVKICIPSTVVSIDNTTFWGCKSLVEANLCEGVRRIDEEAFRDCTSLLRINIPSTMQFIAETAFYNCPLLRNVASPTFQVLECTVDMLKYRFGELPVHELCFYHSRPSLMGYTSNDSVEWIHDDTYEKPPLGDCSTVDCLGMTPLHVLACSGTHAFRLYQHIAESFPNALLATDQWGDVPLTYVMLSDAPMEILLYCLSLHKRLWGEMPFDFVEMINRLVNCKSDTCIRKIILAQRSIFPDLEVNWKGIVEGSKSTQCMVPLSVFRVLVEASASSRPRCMNVEHHIEVNKRIADIQSIYFDPYTHLDEVHRRTFLDRLMTMTDEGTPLDYDRLIGFDEDYRVGLLDEIQGMVVSFAQIRDNLLIGASVTLELALWKAILYESMQLHQPISNIDEVRKIREDSRMMGGKMFQIVIPNVLSFL
jgi:hypothetical protein